MCRRAVVGLPADPTSASDARQFLLDIIKRWDIDEFRDDLLLAVSELVTNSVIHARTPIVLTAVVAGGVVEVGVRDHDPRLPVVRPERDDLLTDLDSLSEQLPSFTDPDPRHPSLWAGPSRSVAAGRGLQLLSAVSDAWGVTTDTIGSEEGKEVWFSHRIPEAWPFRAQCQCDGVSGPPGPSGRNVHPIAGAWDLPSPE